MALPNLPGVRPMRRVNPTATIFDKPTMPMHDANAEPDQDEGNEQQQLADLQQRVSDLEKRVAALEGEEQGEPQPETDLGGGQ